jgi:hypothetical protein
MPYASIAELIIGLPFQMNYFSFLNIKVTTPPKVVEIYCLLEKRTASIFSNLPCR